ncbi:hypothetical protein [Pseudoxanthomonas sp. USHLN014]|uniref:hypothetical protein n=1 Tax=Pseudoxanthomonas sp. USHLN014 TaxID=3081297 RepID=UPI00301BB931
MSDNIMERVARRQAVLLDTAQMKTQFPEWLLRELEEAATDLQDAMAYAQQWREDAERLDFLIRHRARIAFGDSDDPREVIDAARAAREGGA